MAVYVHYKLWSELEDRYGDQLLVKTGSLDIGTKESEVLSGS